MRCRTGGHVVSLDGPAKGARAWWLAVPVLLLLVVALALGLRKDPRYIPSPLVGKPFPAIAGQDLAGNPVTLQAGSDTRPLVVNVWASWCIACKAEHHVLMEVLPKYRQQVLAVGLDYRDDRVAAERWLKGLGDPYEWTFFDHQGLAGLELGVYGAPETFFVGRDGVIRHKHVGPLDADTLETWVQKLLEGGA